MYLSALRASGLDSYTKPFNEMLVSLDGYILIPRVDGKFSVFQDSIDSIVNKDTVTVNIPGSKGGYRRVA